jgi:dihydrofolate reductase
VTEFVSLDGVFESPGPAGDFEHAGWTFRFDRGVEKPDWTNSTVIGIDDVARVKDSHAGILLVAGSGLLVRGLLERGLVDELRLMVFPIVLGSGQRLFDGAPLTRFTLAASQPVGPDGVIVLTYVRA